MAGDRSMIVDSFANGSRGMSALASVQYDERIISKGPDLVTGPASRHDGFQVQGQSYISSNPINVDLIELTNSTGVK